jgi:hypothetical protein
MANPFVPLNKFLLFKGRRPSCRYRGNSTGRSRKSSGCGKISRDTGQKYIATFRLSTRVAAKKFTMHARIFVQPTFKIERNSMASRTDAEC